MYELLNTVEDLLSSASEIMWIPIIFIVFNCILIGLRCFKNSFFDGFSFYNYHMCDSAESNEVLENSDIPVKILPKYVRCRYCDSMFESGTLVCVNCGGNLE